MTSQSVFAQQGVRVIIAVCTRRRPLMLEQCLLSLLTQQMRAGVHVSILVIENDEQPSVQAIVDHIAEQSPVPVHYRLETQAGVSSARNRALDEAVQLGCDWLAFIDDDEEAEPDWLANLLNVASQYGAEVVRGPVVYRYPEADQWMHLRDNSAKHRARPEGQSIKEGATNNVLMSSRLFALNGLTLRFETALNFTGGEDKLFFLQAFNSGIKGVFAPAAVVYETVPLSRCSLKMLYNDKARLAANDIRIQRDFIGIQYTLADYAGLVFKEVRHTVRFVIKSFTSWLKRDAAARTYWLKAVLSVARVHGIVLAFSGKRLESYKEIQGH